MLELVTAGGWLMIVIVACSVLAIAICIERFFVLNTRRIAPPHLLATVWKQLKAGELDSAKLRNLRDSSPLGRILAAGLAWAAGCAETGDTTSADSPEQSQGVDEGEEGAHA